MQLELKATLARSSAAFSHESWPAHARHMRFEQQHALYMKARRERIAVGAPSQRFNTHLGTACPLLPCTAQ